MAKNNTNRPKLQIVGLWRVITPSGAIPIPMGPETEEHRAWGVFLHAPETAELYRGETRIAFHRPQGRGEGILLRGGVST